MGYSEKSTCPVGSRSGKTIVDHSEVTIRACSRHIGDVRHLGELARSLSVGAHAVFESLAPGPDALVLVIVAMASAPSMANNRFVVTN